MEINIVAVNFKIKKELETLIHKKLEKTEKIFHSIQRAEVFLKLGSASEQNNKEVEIKLHVPGNDIFVKKTGESFEKAVDTAVEVSKRQARRKKEKEQNRF